VVAAPSRLEIENDLDTSEHLLDGVDKLFKEFQIAGAEAALVEMHKQLGAYLQFVRNELLPKARDSLPSAPELYAFSLMQVGVDIAPDELARRAHKAFAEIQAEMQEHRPRSPGARLAVGRTTTT